MIEIVASSKDIASINMARAIISSEGLKEGAASVYPNGEINLRIIDTLHLHSEFLDELGSDLIIFLSRHSSASGIPALTVHPTGNWTDEAKLGGKPRMLSVAAPSAMLTVLRGMSGSKLGIEKTYEATHHGPLLNTPSLFAEFGGNEATISDEKTAIEVGNIIYSCAKELINGTVPPRKTVMGIGGSHYASRFTKLALEKGYAFSHIMPKYAMSDLDGILDIIEQAVLKSSERPEAAVIDWKSANSELRSSIIKKLDDIGIDHERI